MMLHRAPRARGEGGERRVEIDDGLSLCCEDLGEREAPCVLLIMGFNMQLVAWDDAFCARLLDAGYRVIRYDNRDVGLSDRLDSLGHPGIRRLLLRRLLGARVSPPYGLEAMADDAAGVLRAHGVSSAHVVGASMGGMIAQLLALRHPERVASLCSIMSHTGELRHMFPEPRLLRLLLNPPGDDADSQQRYLMRFWRAVGSPRWPADPDWLRSFVRGSVARSPGDRGGRERQLAAIIGAAPRTRALARLAIPTQVIHGTADPLIPCDGGCLTARAIPGARLELIEGMGHDLPPPLYDRLTGLIMANAERARG